MMNKFEGVLPLLAALIVLIASLWRADSVLAVSIVCFILLSLYSFFKKNPASKPAQDIARNNLDR